MKTLVKNMLGILIFCLVINGCCPPCPPHPEIPPCPEVEVLKECPVPDAPVYGLFSEDIHVGHRGNLDMMNDNLEKSLRYNDSLESAIECYENQAE